MQEQKSTLRVRVMNKTLTAFLVWISLQLIIIGALEGQLMAQAFQANGNKNKYCTSGGSINQFEGIVTGVVTPLLFFVPHHSWNCN